MKTTNLTLKEAVESGRPWRHGNSPWFFYLHDYNKWLHEKYIHTSDFLSVAMREGFEIKPLPRVIWVNEYNTNPFGIHRSVHETYETAVAYGTANSSNGYIRTIKFIESEE